MKEDLVRGATSCLSEELMILRELHVLNGQRDELNDRVSKLKARLSVVQASIEAFNLACPLEANLEVKIKPPTAVADR